MTTVVTGAWGPRRQFYIDTFVAGFDKYWPGAVKLEVYIDGPVKLPVTGGVGTSSLSGLDDCRGYTEFMLRHRGNPIYCGRVARTIWKPREMAAGYSFRTDAVKFAGQAFAPLDASERLPDGELMVWLDADVVTHTKVPLLWIDDLVGDADGAYLGREPKHSEIGFWAVRLNAHTRAMLKDFAELYRSDTLFSLKEWHSAFAWDHARRGAEAYGVNLRNLTPGGSGHVWFQSPLKEFTDHLKGSRKARGASKERRRA